MEDFEVKILGKALKQEASEIQEQIYRRGYAFKLNPVVTKFVISFPQRIDDQDKDYCVAKYAVKVGSLISEGANEVRL